MKVVRYFIIALLLIVAQVIIFDRFSIGYGINIMICPIFILLLPFRMKATQILLIAFAFGLTLDAVLNTYGLHSSALVLLAYIRPFLFSIISPSDSYMRGESTEKYASRAKFAMTLLLALSIHHIWYFVLESFTLNEFLFTLQRIGLSTIASFIFCYIIFNLFFMRRHLEE